MSTILLFLAFLLLISLPHHLCAPPKYVDFVVAGRGSSQTWILRAFGAAQIAECRQRVKDGDKQKGFPIGLIGYSNETKAYPNFDNGNHRLYHWYMKEGWHFTEMAIELCDGTPQYVDDHLDEWIASVKYYCPWNGYIKKELFTPNNNDDEISTQAVSVSYVDFVVGGRDLNTTWILRAFTPAQIAECRQRAKDGLSQVGFPSGLIGYSNDTTAYPNFDVNNNRTYHWYMKEGWKFADFTIELCDGTPTYVDDNLDEWIRDVKAYCPWGGYILRELNPPTYVDFVVAGRGSNETWILRAHTPAQIAECRQRVKENKAQIGFPIGLIGYSNETKAYPNYDLKTKRKYDWYMKEGWEFTEMAIELCDGTPRYVDDHLDEWIDKVKYYCPWNGYIVSEVNTGFSISSQYPLPLALLFSSIGLILSWINRL